MSPEEHGGHHDEEDVPDEEAWSTRRSARRRECRVLVLRVLVGLGRDAFPRLDVAMQLPLLLVDERLDVDRRDLAAVFFEIQLGLGPFGCYRQRQVLTIKTYRPVAARCTTSGVWSLPQVVARRDRHKVAGRYDSNGMITFMTPMN